MTWLVYFQASLSSLLASLEIYTYENVFFFDTVKFSILSDWFPDWLTTQNRVRIVYSLMKTNISGRKPRLVSTH